MKTQAIIPTAGLGTRMRSDVTKFLMELEGDPIIVLTLKAFQESSLVESVILVVQEDHREKMKDLISEYSLTKVKEIVVGGETRFDSVHNGLAKIDADTDVIVVHDGARPLIDASTINKAIKQCEQSEAVVVAVPVKSTIKRVNKENLLVEETLNRNELWEVQTPQVFKREILVKAHENAQGIAATDDAMLVEQLGIKVEILEGSYKNIKITTQEDLKIARVFLQS